MIFRVIFLTCSQILHSSFNATLMEKIRDANTSAVRKIRGG